MTTPGEGESIDKRQQAAKDMLDDLIEQSGAESTGEEYEIVDALAEGTEDSPVEITESGLKLNLNFGDEEEYSQPAPEAVSEEELAALAAVEAELNMRWPESKLEPSLSRIEMLMDLLGNPETGEGVDVEVADAHCQHNLLDVVQHAPREVVGVQDNVSQLTLELPSDIGAVGCDGRIVIGILAGGIVGLVRLSVVVVVIVVVSL